MWEYTGHPKAARALPYPMPLTLLHSGSGSSQVVAVVLGLAR
jgi:hypothetical protein